MLNYGMNFNRGAGWPARLCGQLACGIRYIYSPIVIIALVGVSISIGP